PTVRRRRLAVNEDGTLSVPDDALASPRCSPRPVPNPRAHPSCNGSRYSPVIASDRVRQERVGFSNSFRRGLCTLSLPLILGMFLGTARSRQGRAVVWRGVANP